MRKSHWKRVADYLATQPLGNQEIYERTNNESWCFSNTQCRSESYEPTRYRVVVI